MHGNLLNQLDFIYFLYGFSYLLVALMAWTWARSGKDDLPWGKLVVSGLLIGFAQWLELLALSVLDSTPFQMARFLLKGAAYLFLMEFGRQGLRKRWRLSLGVWLYPVILAAASLGAFAGIDGFRVGVYYAVGFPAALLVGLLFLHLSKTRLPMALAGAASLVTGLSLLFFPPPADFFPASVLNSATFFQLTGMPVQVLRALCALLIALGVWLTYARDWETHTKEDRLRRWLIPLLTALFIVGGWWLTNVAGNTVSASTSELLLSQANGIARTIDPDAVKQLRFDDSDAQNPEYQKLSHQLASYAELVGFRSVYTLAKRGDALIFGPESLAQDDPWSSPPGTVYEQPSDRTLRIFEDGQAFFEGPVTDEYGTFVSALAPVLDPLTGDVLLVVGIDMDAGSWQAEVSHARLLPILATLLQMTFLLVSSVYHFQKQKESFNARLSWLKYIDVFVTVSAGLLFTLVASLLAANNELLNQRLRFSNIAEAQVNSVMETLYDITADKMLSMVSFFENSELVTRTEFHDFAAGFQKNGSLAVWAWIPVVQGNERQAYEWAARQDGLADFTFRDIDENGQFLPAPPRDTHYPVYYLSPMEGNECWLGLDLASFPSLLTQAAHSGFITASDAFLLPNEDSKEYGTLFLHPVYAEDVQGKTLIGYLAASLNWTTLLQREQSQFFHRESYSAIEIYQLNRGEESVQLTTTMTNHIHSAADFSFARQKASLYHVSPFFAAGKTYAILVHPEEGFLQENPRREGWVVGGVGLLLTLSLAAFIGLMEQRQLVLEQQVRERTAALRESEARWQFALEGAGDGVWDINFLQNKAYYSRQWKAMLGYEEHEISDDPLEFDRCVHPDDLLCVKEEDLQGIAAGNEYYVSEFRMRCKDGSYKWILSRGKIVEWTEDGQPARAIGTHSDITQRKQMEEALRASELTFRALFQNNHAVMLLINPQTGDIIEANPAACAYYGWSREEMLQKKISEINTLSVDQVRAEMQKAVTEQRNYFWFKHRLANGQVRDVEVFSGPIERQGQTLLYSIIHDITERKRAEEALRHSEERFRLIMGATNDGLWDWNFVHPEQTYLSPNYYRILGYEPEEIELRQNRWIDLVHPDDRKQVERINEGCECGEVQVFEMEFRMRTKDGGWKWILSRGRAVAWDENGKTVRMVGTQMDITARKNAEENLRESEERFRLAMEATSDGLYDADILTGERYFSPNYFRMLGYEPGEFPMSVEAWKSLIHPDDWPLVEKLNSDYIENRTSTLEGTYRMRTKTGEWKWILGRGKAVSRDENGKPRRIIGTHVDLTESKRAEEKLREAENKYRTLVENSQSIIYTLTPEGIFSFVSPSWKTLLGHEVDEVVNHDFRLFVHAEDVSLCEELLRKSAESKMTQPPVEYRVFAKDGSIHWHRSNITPVFDTHGNLISFVGNAVDLTELKHSEEKFAKSFRSSGVLMAISELESGRFVDVNEAFLQTLGYRREEVIGHTSAELIIFTEPAKRSKLIEEVREKGNVRDVEVEARTRSGQTRFGLFSVDIIDLQGKPHLLTSMLDITEHKQAEEALQTSQKYAELGTLAAGVAHELNTPLQIVTGSADSLLKQLDLPDPVKPERLKRYLENISRNSWRMAEIVRMLNTYARTGKGDVQAYNLNDLIRDTLLLVEHQLHTWSNIHVELALQENIPDLFCNRNDITQILINLMTNARDAMPHGGKILLSSAYQPESDNVILEVSDTGLGIPEDIQKRVFDPFFTTKPIGKGTGLGLSIVHGIVHNYGGHIELVSAPGKGATFRLFLPCKPDLPEEGNQKDQSRGRYL